MADLTAERIRGRLDTIAPPPTPGAPPTATGLARRLAVDAQVAWARMMDTTTPTAMCDIAAAQGCFAAAHTLLAFAAVDPGRADETAAQVAAAFGDGAGIGEWIWEHLGDHAAEVAGLADALTRTTTHQPPVARTALLALAVHLEQRLAFCEHGTTGPAAFAEAAQLVRRVLEDTP